jgi:hypothetical protein
MANTDPLLRSVLAYATAPTWEAARDLLARNPALLSDRAVQLMQGIAKAMAAMQPANTQVTLLQDRLTFMQRALAVGVNAAWDERKAKAPPQVAADPMQLPMLVGNWLDTPTYQQQRDFLASHLELLDPLVDRIMAALVQQFAGKDNEKFLRASWQWLQRARTDGLDAGWQLFCQQMGLVDNSPAMQQLLQTLLDWLNTPTFEDQRAFLASHPTLLDPAVDTLLEHLIVQYAGQPQQERLLRASLVWIQKARQSGLDAGWMAFQIAMTNNQPQSI